MPLSDAERAARHRQRTATCLAELEAEVAALRENLTQAEARRDQAIAETDFLKNLIVDAMACGAQALRDELAARPETV